MVFRNQVDIVEANRERFHSKIERILKMVCDPEMEIRGKKCRRDAGIPAKSAQTFILTSYGVENKFTKMSIKLR